MVCSPHWFPGIPRPFWRLRVFFSFELLKKIADGKLDSKHSRIHTPENWISKLLTTGFFCCCCFAQQQDIEVTHCQFMNPNGCFVKHRNCIHMSITAARGRPHPLQFVHLVQATYRRRVTARNTSFSPGSRLLLEDCEPSSPLFLLLLFSGWSFSLWTSWLLGSPFT